MRAIVLTEINGEPRADSRDIARGLRNQHKAVMVLIERYAKQFKALGVLPFEMEKPSSPRGGRPERFALLNEDQAFLLLTMARNTDYIVDMKTALVKAFRQAQHPLARWPQFFARFEPGHSAVLPIEFRDRVSTAAKKEKAEGRGTYTIRATEDGQNFRVWRVE